MKKIKQGDRFAVYHASGGAFYAVQTVTRVDGGDVFLDDGRHFNESALNQANDYGILPIADSTPEPTEPIPMRLTCPECGVFHVDEGEFATKPHHTHACQRCGMVWRPAVVNTVGVRFLPGFKDGGP